MPHPTAPSVLEHLTRALVLHVRDLLDDYPEGAVVLPREDGEFAAWSARVPGFPGPLAVGVCARSALHGPLSHVLEETHDGRGVLIVCDVADTAPPVGAAAMELPDHTDLIEVHHRSEISGAVLEALAGDVPLVVDVRLSREDGASLLTSGPGAPVD